MSAQASAGTNINYGKGIADVGSHVYTASYSADLLVTHSTGLSDEFARPVSGTVYDEDGNAISDADVTIEDDTGSAVTSLTSASDGSWSTDLLDGNYTATASKPDYQSNSTTFSVSGSAVSGVNITLTQPDVTVRVTDTSNAPVEGATVETWGSKKPSVSEAKQNLTELSNQLPSEFETQLNDQPRLLGDGGLFADSEAQYAGVYAPEDIGVGYFGTDSADLSSPQWRRLPANQELVFVAGDASKRGGILDEAQEYNRQVPGHVIDEGPVIAERIAPSGGVVTRKTITLDETHSTGSLGPLSDPSKLHYGTATLTSGYWKISVEGSSLSYYVRVGHPEPTMDEALKTINGKITGYSDRINSVQSSGTVVRKTATTNSSGYATVSMPNSVKAVQVQSYKASTVPTDPANLTRQDIRDHYEASSQTEGAIYVPSRPKQVDVPSTTTVTMTEVRWPPAANISALQDQLDKLENKLETQVQNAVQKHLPGDTGLTLEDLRQRYRELSGLIRANPALEETYLQFSERDSVASAGDLSKSELKTEIAHMNQALAATASGGATANEPTVSGDTVSQSWTLNGVNLDAANVSVVAHWSNGSKTPVSGEYISINPDLVGQGGKVTVSEFPIGSSDPAAVEFELTVAAPNGVAKGRSAVRNPALSGNLPEIAALELNTMSPGPDDTVQIQVHPSGSSSFKNVSSATAYGPDGTTLSATVSGGDTVRFSTAGKGVHRAEITIYDNEGNRYVETVRVHARETDLPAPPSVRARSSPLGVMAVVSDGFTGGDVDVQSDRVAVTARVPSKNEPPRRVHIYSGDLSTGADAPTELKIVRGEQGRSINQHVYVTAHIHSLPDEGYMWRGEQEGFGQGDDEPITRSGATQFGEITVRNNGTTVNTFTRADGSVTLDPSPNPGALERAEHTIDVQTAGIDIPILQAAP